MNYSDFKKILEKIDKNLNEDQIKNYYSQGRRKSWASQREITKADELLARSNPIYAVQKEMINKMSSFPYYLKNNFGQLGWGIAFIVSGGILFLISPLIKMELWLHMFLGCFYLVIIIVSGYTYFSIKKKIDKVKGVDFEYLDDYKWYDFNNPEK